ncbi:MAG: hypothetical protein MJY77_07520 [Bacteroidaceae bacterium]|nr:hypothetical protein [Bacteroidaceae bacterium]
MRKVCILIITMLVSISISAQETKSLSTVILNNGMSINGYVEPQADGGYKVTSESGDVFYYSFSDVRRVKDNSSSDVKRVKDNSSSEMQRDLKYWQYKKMYNARDYSYELGDKYRVGGVGAASFLFPGLGQYITGCQVGLGILQTFIWSCGVANIIASDGDGSEVFIIPGAASVLAMSIWSCCSAKKAAKIKNMYLRDKSHGSIGVDVKPYLSFDPMSLQNNSFQPVFGATLTLNI